MSYQTDIPAFLGGVKWEETNATDGGGSLPHATHFGVLEIVGHSLRCYRLSDGRAIIHADDLQTLMRSWFGDEEQE